MPSGVHVLGATAGRLTCLGCATTAIMFGVLGGPYTKSSPAVNEPSPFSIAVGYDPITGDHNQGGFENGIAACMRSRGFKYMPYIPRTIVDHQPTADQGYFISGPLLDDWHQIYPNVELVIAQNPNGEIRSRLSAEDQQGYDKALNGILRESLSPIPTDQMGCVSLAQLKLYGGDGEFPPAMLAAIESISSDIRSDQVYISAVAAWSACVAKQGFRARERSELMSQFSDDVAAALGAKDIGNGVTLSNGKPSQRALGKIFERERAAAAADVKCEAEQDLGPLLSALQRSYERKFLDANPAFARVVVGAKSGHDSVP
jgi:hypothetical protein